MKAAVLARQFTELRTLHRLLKLYEVVYGENVSNLRMHIADQMKKLSKQIYYSKHEDGP